MFNACVIEMQFPYRVRDHLSITWTVRRLSDRFAEWIAFALTFFTAAAFASDTKTFHFSASFLVK